MDGTSASGGKKDLMGLISRMNKVFVPEGRKKDLLEILNSTGRMSLTEAAEKIGLDNLQANKLAEQLRAEGRILIEKHYLKEPDLESVDYNTKQAGLSELSVKKVPVHTPEVPKARVTPPEMTASAEAKPGEAKVPEAKEKRREEKTIEIDVESYTVKVDDIHYSIRIVDTGDFVPHYLVAMPRIDFVTRALLDETKRALIGEIQIESREVFDPEKFQKLRTKFLTRAREKLKSVLQKASDEYIAVLSRILVNEMIGLGDMEYLLLDDNIEEVVVNSSRDVVWVYHRKHGWLKSNVLIPTEDLIMNYSSRVAREVGREITHLKPMLDAHLISGDRVNSTLYPISTQGNTITIRRFSRTPWTAIHLIDPKLQTFSPEIAAFLWMAVEYEMNVLIAGGTASGKTTILNALMPFMPANQRIISMEDTRELNLPEYLHWVPLTIRPTNPEGEGGVSMLDLLQNSLRMRPDRVIVGEVRARAETEVMFEAMHTGHSVYSTFHAERASEVIERITSPPMSIPPAVLKSLHLIVIQYRNRRTKQRKTFEVCEITKDESDVPTLNTLYKWNPITDTIDKMYPSIRVKDDLAMFTGMTESDIESDLHGKRMILEWMLENKIYGVNDVGRIVTEYYLDKQVVLDLIKSKDVKIK